MKHRFLKAFSAIVMSALVCSCSAVKPHRQPLTVLASEPDTMVYVNSKPVGKAPVTTRVKRNRAAVVRGEKEGYHVATRTVDVHFSNTAILDTIGAVLILVPGIGLLTPGAWDLDDTEVYLKMFEKE